MPVSLLAEPKIKESMGSLKEDRLGLDLVYLQAKRREGSWQPKVCGALHGKRARKGVFITTGKFSDDEKVCGDN